MKDYSFGNFLLELRERSGLSQFQLGRLVGVTDKAVSKWETGKSKPKLDLLFKLADIFEVTVEELKACKYNSSNDEKEKGVFARRCTVKDTTPVLFAKASFIASQLYLNFVQVILPSAVYWRIKYH